MSNIKNSSKSRRYPSIELSYAIDVVKEAAKFGTKITDTQIAGGGSTKSGAFVKKKASLGYYGLIEGRGDNYEITSLSKSILYPKSDEEKKIAIQQAFTSATVFDEVYSIVAKNEEIDLDFFGNMIVREFGIKATAKEKFLNTFIKSGKYAGLIEQVSDKTILVRNLYENTDRDEEEGQEEIPDNETLTLPKKERNNSFEFEGFNQQQAKINLSKGIGVISVPENLSKEDVKKLKAQIDILSNFIDA